MIILLPTHLAEILVVDFPHHQWFARVIITDLSSFDLIMPALIVFIPPTASPPPPILPRSPLFGPVMLGMSIEDDAPGKEGRV